MVEDLPSSEVALALVRGVGGPCEHEAEGDEEVAEEGRTTGS